MSLRAAGGLGHVGRTLRRMWLAQDDAPTRLAMARTLTGVSALVMLAKQPDATLLEEHHRLLEEAGQPRAWGWLDRRAFQVARVGAAGALVAWTLGSENRLVKCVANVGFAASQRHVAAFHDDLWSYTVNVNAYLLALSAVDSSWQSARRGGPVRPEASAVLAAMQTYQATVYLQSGVSKLRSSGLRWMDGRTLRGSWSELGTPLGRTLSGRDRRIAAAASVGTILFEVGFLPALLAAWKQRRLLGLAALAFHASVKATMGISFWHHSLFTFPLFVLPARRRRRDDPARTAA